MERVYTFEVFVDDDQLDADLYAEYLREHILKARGVTDAVEQ